MDIEAMLNTIIHDGMLLRETLGSIVDSAREGGSAQHDLQELLFTIWDFWILADRFCDGHSRALKRALKED